MKQRILLATRTEARLVGWDKENHPEVLRQIKNPLGRLKSREMETDKPGSNRTRFRGNRRPHSMTGEKNPHDQAADQFARKVSKWLKTLDRQGVISGPLTVSAEPKFLGKLKKELGLKELSQTSLKWLRKDLGKTDLHDIPKHLKKASRTSTNADSRAGRR